VVCVHCADPGGDLVCGFRVPLLPVAGEPQVRGDRERNPRAGGAQAAHGRRGQHQFERHPDQRRLQRLHPPSRLTTPFFPLSPLIYFSVFPQIGIYLITFLFASQFLFVWYLIYF